MKSYIIFVISLISVIFISCEKVITLSPPPYTSKVSIQSMLEPDSVPIVYYNRTVPYFDKNVSFGDLIIRNAQVKIQSSTGTDNLKLDSAYDRLYCQYNYYYKGSIPVKSNLSYTLTITDGADIYSASAETNLLAVSIDSVGYAPTFSDLYGEHEGVLTYFKDVPSQANFYRYEMARFVDTTVKFASERIANFCLGRDSILIHELGRSVYSDAGLSAQQIKLVIEPAYTHKRGTRGLVYIQSIDKNAYEFFDQLDKQKLSQFNPFVEPVFLRDGQFGNRAIGYFSAMVKSKPVVFVFPE
jgi:hypothetical protein